jgi:hypothetical protein
VTAPQTNNEQKAKNARGKRGPGYIITIFLLGVALTIGSARFINRTLVMGLCIVVIWLLVAFVYYLLRRNVSNHTRELSFTIWFSTVAFVAVIVPMILGHVHSLSAKVECVPDWGQVGSWFAQGVPCTLTIPLHEKVPVDLDEFMIWEIAAIAQTFVFGISVFWEMKRSQFDRRTFLAVLAIVILPLFALLSIIAQWWRLQLVATAAFVVAICFEDFFFWRIECKKIKDQPAGDPIDSANERDFFANLTFALDLPLVIATIVLVFALWQPYNADAMRGARHFFAGAMAFSLIVANAGLVAYRMRMHRQELIKHQASSLLEFIGLR